MIVNKSMVDLIKKIILGFYYLIIILLSLNNFDYPGLQSLYDFFDDKDKFMHFIQYFVLIVLALFTLSIKVNFKNFILICLFLMISSGLAEFIQLYLSSRDSSYMDWFYDIIGGVSGFFIFASIDRLCYKN